MHGVPVVARTVQFDDSWSNLRIKKHKKLNLNSLQRSTWVIAKIPMNFLVSGDMKKILSIVLIVFGVGAFVHAEDLLQIYELAIQHDPEFAQAEIRKDLAEVSSFQSLTPLLPSGGVSVFGTNWSKSKNRTTFPLDFLRNDPRAVVTGVTPETNEQWTTRESPAEGVKVPSGYSVNLSQVVFSIPTFVNYRNSRLNYQNSIDAYATAERSLIIRVTQAYFDVLRTRDQLESTLASGEAIQRQLDQAEQRYDVGLSAITDVLNARASYDQHEVSLEQSKNGLDNSFLVLNRIAGQPVLELARLAPDYPVVNPNPNEEQHWVDLALRNNPGILQAERGYSQARWSHWSQITRDLPTISFGVSYSYSENPFTLGGLDTSINTISESISTNTSVSLRLSFSSGGGFASNRQSALNRESARLGLISQRLTVEEQTRRQFRQVNTQVLRIAALKRSIESSQASLDATQTGYEVGTRNIVEVLRAQQQLFNARFSYESAVYEYIQSMLQLLNTVGELTEAHIAELNRYMDYENLVTPIDSASGA